MNEELKEHLESLAIDLRRQHKEYRKSFRNMIIFSLTILVFFSLYTALVSYKIKEIATPETVAFLIADQLQQESKPNQYISKTDIRLLAKEILHSGLEMLPLAGPLTEYDCRTLIQNDAEYTIQCITGKSEKDLQHNIDEIIENPALSEKEIDQKISGIMNKMSRNDLLPGLAVLSLTPGFYAERLHNIRLKDKTKLNRQELAEKQFILCCLYLNDRKRFLDTNLIAVFPLMSSILREFGFFRSE